MLGEELWAPKGPRVERERVSGKNSKLNWVGLLGPDVEVQWRQRKRNSSAERRKTRRGTSTIQQKKRKHREETQRHSLW